MWRKRERCRTSFALGRLARETPVHDIHTELAGLMKGKESAAMLCALCSLLPGSSRLGPNLGALARRLDNLPWCKYPALAPESERRSFYFSTAELHCLRNDHDAQEPSKSETGSR